MPAQKSIPMRQCLGCREMKPKKELIRIVRTPEGNLSVDLKGKANGRGAYLCRNAACLKKAEKAGALSKAFGCSAGTEVYESLRAELEAEHDG